MDRGGEIDAWIRVRGLSLRWTSLVIVWEPPHRFVDEQVRGPYRRFVHEHRFEEVVGGTRVVDHVDYDVPGGRLLSGVLNRLLVAPDLAALFDFRQRRLREIFGGDRGLSGGDLKPSVGRAPR
jgi:ligand-binding SRPBCC domain-containing protein